MLHCDLLKLLSTEVSFANEVMQKPQHSRSAHYFPVCVVALLQFAKQLTFMIQPNGKFCNTDSISLKGSQHSYVRKRSKSSKEKNDE